MLWIDQLGKTRQHLGGYGYQSTLASLERCVESAVAGKVL
jgi:hypothetical protein